MPSLASSNRSRTASAMTWAVEWRIASRASWAPASSSSSTDPRSGASRISSSGAGSVTGASAIVLSKNRNDPSSRQDERSTDSTSRGSTRLHDLDALVGLGSCARAAITGGPGPVLRSLTGGAAGSSMSGFQPRLAALARLSLIDWIRWRVPIDALFPTIPHASLEAARASVDPDGARCRAPSRSWRRCLDVDHAEEQKQDDQEPRHAEDPEQQRNHLGLLSGRKRGP